jgi:glycosyltransferase involved in cell wall biosynthesis
VHDYRFICPAYLFLDGNNQICEKCKSGFYLNCTLKKCSEGNFFQSLLLSVDAYYRKYRINPVRFAERFIFVSDFIRQKHIEFNPAYLPKASLLYNFVPGLEKVNPVHTKGDYFLFYGRLSREKGVDTLIQAAQQAGIRLKLAGTGSLSEKYGSSPDPRIEFLGHQTGAALWKLVSQASFVLVPSEWYENNPLTILEAYGLGKPVIGSRIGGIPEIVQDGQSGFLFEPGNINELAALLKKAADMDELEYQRMSMSARRFANKTFEPEKHYAQLIKIYTETIQAFNN